MLEELNKETLKRLYVKERKPLQEIARIFNCSTTCVVYRCKKHGIKRRPIARDIKGLNKSTLHRLYVKEGKPASKIGKIFLCSPITVQRRCIKYGIELRKPRKLNREILHKLYIEEGKTIRETAETLGCSREYVRIRCKEFGIKLRQRKKFEVDESIFHRLCFKEGKTYAEIAEMLDCAVSTISKRVRKFMLNK